MPERRKRVGIGALRALLLAAGAAALSPAVAAQAQEAMVLRGSVQPGGILSDAVPLQGLEPAPDGSVGLDDSGNAQQGASAAPLPPADRRAAEEENTDGVVRVGPVDADDNLPLDPGAERATAIEGLEKTVDENPFAPTGVRWGSFILKPTLEQGITATSNADLSSGGSSAVLSETILRLNAVSDWASNSAEINAFGIFRDTISGEEVQDVIGNIDANAEFDVGNDYTASANLGFQIAPESAASPVVIPDTESEPLHMTFSGGVGLEKDVGKMQFGIRGNISHDTYEDAELDDGTTLSQKDRDSTLYAMTLRTGYEISPAITPFVETAIGRRLYDEKVDTAGYERSSSEMEIRGGVAMDFGEKLSGEASLGWIRETFDDDRLEPISAPALAANISWSPIRGTLVNLDGSTTLESSTTPGESGSLLYAARLSVVREMRANLTGNALVGLGWRDYYGTEGHDLIFDAEASLTWWLNRYLGLTGRYVHQTVDSNLPDRDATTNSIFLGLKVQR